MRLFLDPSHLSYLRRECYKGTARVCYNIFAKWACAKCCEQCCS